MANIVFTEASGVADSVYGNCQAPIKLFLEKRGEDFEKYSALKHLFDRFDRRRDRKLTRSVGVTRVFRGLAFFRVEVFDLARE